MNFKEWYELQEFHVDYSADVRRKHPLGIKAYGDGSSSKFDPKSFDYDHYFSKEGQKELRRHLRSKSWFKKDDWITWDGKEERVDDVEADQVELGEPTEYKMPFRLYWKKGDAFTTGVTQMLKQMDAHYTYKSGVPTIWLHGNNDMAEEFLDALERGDEGVIERTKKVGYSAGARYINV